MSRSFRTCVPCQGEHHGPTAPRSPPGPPLRTRDDFYECTTRVCHRGRSNITLLKGCKRKRSNQKCADDAKYHTENELFSHKCSELQCYLAPLSSILRGLKSGRYSGRLSSFQESLAIDRIQRILGVLQSPRPGGRFLNTVLKLEQMLHSWFPHVRDKWLFCSLHAPLPWPRPPPAGHAHPVTQDNAVSSSSDVRTPAPPTDRSTAPRPPGVALRSPCLERLLQAKESIIQTRTEARADQNQNQNQNQDQDQDQSQHQNQDQDQDQSQHQHQHQDQDQDQNQNQGQSQSRDQNRHEVLFKTF